MNSENPLEILKSAILLEKRGQAFYSQAAQSSTDRAVKEFFSLMADEEVTHIKVLSEQYRAYQDNQQFSAGTFEDRDTDRIAAEVLTDQLKDAISAASFEAAAISAAIAMEQRAIAIYGGRAETAEDPEEKTLYRWLADWERTHLKLLSDLDRELTERIWNDNNFWPM